MINSHTHYVTWALERFVRWFVRYILILPLCIVLWPITQIGNWLDEMYCRL